MNKYNNPASRLHAFLSAAFTKKNETAMQIVWQELFSLEKNDIQKISLVQPRLIKLAFKVGEQIESIPHLQRKDIYLKHVNKISSALFRLGHIHSVHQLKNEINQDLLDNLQICSDLLNSNSINEQSLDDDILDKLRNEVQSLLEQIEKLNLNDEFKKALQSIIFELKYAIDYYIIHGVDGFKLYTERFLGHLIINKDNFDSMKGESDNKEVFSEIFRVFDQSNKLVAFAKNTTLALPYIEDFVRKLTVS